MATKKASRKITPTKTTRPKGTKKKASAKKSSRVTVKIKALQALAKGRPLSAAQVKEAIKLGHSLKPTLDKEVQNGNLKYAPNQGEGGRDVAYYEISAAGKKLLAS